MDVFHGRVSCVDQRFNHININNRRYLCSSGRPIEDTLIDDDFDPFSNDDHLEDHVDVSLAAPPQTQ